MADQKIIAVVGATGAQGGGLARAILDDPNGGFAARALTRKPDSEAAKALRRRGAEVVACDLDDAASVKKAFAGAHGAYCMTNYWEHFSADRELAQARNMAEAAKGAGVQHVDLVHARGHAEVGAAVGQAHAHADGQVQGAALRRARARPTASSGRSGAPTTFLLTSFYWDNFIHFGMGPKKGPDGTSRHHAADGATRSCRPSRSRTSAAAPTASSRRAATSSARPWASPASI